MPEQKEVYETIESMLRSMDITDRDDEAVRLLSKEDAPLGRLFHSAGFRAWYDSIRVKSDGERSEKPRVKGQWRSKNEREDDVTWLARYFHAYLLQHTELLLQACDRDVAGSIFREFYKEQKEGTYLLSSTRFMESLVMARLRKLKLLRSWRVGDLVMMAFADLDGNFPSNEQIQLDQLRVLEARNITEANKEGIIISAPPPLGFVPINKAHVFHLTVTAESTSDDKDSDENEKSIMQYQLEAVKVTGPYSKRFALTSTQALPVDLSQSRIVEVTATPRSVGILRASVVFVFSKPDGEAFEIHRHLSCKSGNENMNKMLAPVSPYMPKKYQATKEKHNKIFDPPPLEGMTAPDPFKGKLGQYRVPAEVKTRLIKKKLGDILSKLEPEKQYAAFWSTLLWACEFQEAKDIQLYDMEAVRLKKAGRLFELTVPGLAEGRPSVLRGDLVHITWKKNLYKGRVRYTRLLEVGIELAQSFHHKYSPSLDLVNVQFTFSRMSYRTSHAGCAEAGKSMKKLLHPDEKSYAAPAPRARAVPADIIGWKWANRALNLEQQMAVKHVVRGRMRPLAHLIFGPPGTGKTVTVVETVYQLAQKCGLKILLVAPSNDAADILVERLMSYFNPSEMRRILAYSRTLETVPKSIHRFVTVGGPSAEEIVSPSVRIVVSTVNLAARFSYLGVTKGLFDVLCVDEAGCATEPEVIAVAASLMDFDQDAQIVLAGDPKQLGPIIASELCNEFGMSASYMARLMNHKLYSRNDGEYRPDYVTKLVRNYRSHSSIIKLPNSMFYDNELICNGDQLATHSLSKWEHLPKKGFPIIFHAVEGENLRESNSPSWFNPQEAEQVVDYVKMLIHETRPPLLPTDIGVITPYARQAQKIRLAVESSGIKDVKVGSVETFQGQERRCIIVSTVRSVREQVSVDIKYNLGFVANEKRFNVAITRAISLLIVVGCPHVLAMDEANWLPFLRYCHENGAWCGEDWDPSTQIEEIKSDSSSDDESWECVDRPSQRAEQEGFVFTSREE